MFRIASNRLYSLGGCRPLEVETLLRRTRPVRFYFWRFDSEKFLLATVKGVLRVYKLDVVRLLRPRR